ncbi:MAG: hypothetical protein JOY99_11135 [Sphingomonadaceae bacterium]|nr:hypothetical protein [Sphingomonadaceae bacterium]
MLPDLTSPGAMRAFREVAATAELPFGWRYGEGIPSGQLARENAGLCITIFSLAQVDEITVLPDPDGGIMIIGYRGFDSFEILCLASGRFEVQFDDGSGDFPIETVETLADLQEKLRGRGWNLSSISVSFHQNIMTSGSVAITGLLSKTRPAEASPLSSYSACSITVLEYVGTSSSIILGDFVGRHQHFGDLAQMSYRQPPASSNQTRLLETNAITTYSA